MYLFNHTSMLVVRTQLSFSRLPYPYMWLQGLHPYSRTRRQAIFVAMFMTFWSWPTCTAPLSCILTQPIVAKFVGRVSKILSYITCAFLIHIIYLICTNNFLKGSPRVNSDNEGQLLLSPDPQ